jgi:hypothetical protein
MTKQTCNTVVTESGIFKFACINFSDAKTLLQFLPKRSSPFFFFLSSIYTKNLWLETQWFHKCSYNREERNHSTSPTLFSKSARCLSLRDSVHMIHLSTNWDTSCEGTLNSWEERNHSISPILFSKGARCLSLHGFGVHDTFVHKLGYKL